MNLGSRGGPSRRAGNAKARRGVTLVTYDGEKTEAEYFRGWKMTLGNLGIVIEPYYVASGGNVLRAVEKTVSLIENDPNFEEIWCVCDVDDTCQNDINRARMLAARHNISLCLSARCFEVWFGLHWARSAAPILSERQAIALVNGRVPAYSKTNKIVPFGLLYPLTQTAINNGIWLSAQAHANPSTEVHTLIEKLVEREKNAKRR